MFTAGRVRVIALAAADCICVFAMWAVAVSVYWWLGRLLMAVGIRTGIGGYDLVDYLQFWPVALVFVGVNALLGLYHGSWMYPAAPLSPVEEMRRLFFASFLTHVGIIAFLGLLFQTTQGFSRVVIAVSGVLVAFASQSFRNWMRFLLLKSGVAQIPVLLSGGGEVACRVVESLADNPYLGLRVVGYFEGTMRIGRRKRRRRPNDQRMEELGIPYLGTLREVVPAAKKRDVKILLACQDERLFQLQMEEFAGWFTYIEYLPTARAFPVFGARAVSFDGIGGLEMVNQGRMRAMRVQKRVLDTTLAVLAFICLSPFFVLLPLLIKLTSRGPVFYRQARLGRGGKTIHVWKFRSMYADADARLTRLLAENPVAAEEWRRNYKLANDPRVTPFGRFLRRTSLDELPQLFNVFWGDMALIGPRPIVQGEVAYYGDAYVVFSSVRPGVTGLWQVSGRSDTDYARRVALDTYYVLNWSPWMDIWILVRTVYAVLFMHGAR